MYLTQSALCKTAKPLPSTQAWRRPCQPILGRFLNQQGASVGRKSARASPAVRFLGACRVASDAQEDMSNLPFYQNGDLAGLPEEDWPAYLLRWATALSQPRLDMAEMEALSPQELAVYLVECAKADKRAAKSYGALVVRHLLCLKYANDLDMARDSSHWQIKIFIFREQLKDICDGASMQRYFAEQAPKIFEVGLNTYRMKELKFTIGSPAETLEEEGLSPDRLLEAWWPERIREARARTSTKELGPEYQGMFLELETKAK